MEKPDDKGSRVCCACRRHVPSAGAAGVKVVEWIGHCLGRERIGRKKKDPAESRRVREVIQEGIRSVSNSELSGLFRGLSAVFIKSLNKLCGNLIRVMPFDRGSVNHFYKFPVAHQRK